MSVIEMSACRGVCVVTALRHEFLGAHCYTGIGKLNAAINLSSYINTYKPSLVINVGSCGSRNDELKNKVVRASQFVEWDKEVIKGFEAPVVLEENNNLKLPYKKVVCGTGDRFYTGQNINCDIFDMEAYALAKTCRVNDIQFLSLKYVSDSGCIDQWEESLSKIDLIFEEVLTNILESI